MLRVKTTLRPSGIHGLGCFAAADIAAGDVVWQFDPHLDVTVRSDEMAALSPAARDFLGTHGYRLADADDDLIVLCGDHARHMNHSSDPNVVEIDDLVGSNVAARDIRAGEELTCNYHDFDLDAEQKLAGATRMRETDEFSFRLGVSRIQGVGVFANHDIEGRVRLDLFDEDTRFVAEAPSEPARRLLETYGVEGEGGRGYYCPRSFTRIDVGWFLNHSDTPNAGHVDWEYYSLAPIREGEEVTIDYRTLGESKVPPFCGTGSAKP